MVVESDLLAILVCPENHQPLVEMESAALERLNERLASGELKNRDGAVVKGPLEGALLRAGEDVVYPVERGVPVLLVKEGIPLAG